MKNLHIVNGRSAAGSLRYVFKSEGIDSLHEVYCVDDFLSFGPLCELGKRKGIENRARYIFEILRFQGDKEYALQSIIDNITSFLEFDFFDFKKVIVWHGKNAHEGLLKLLCCSLVAEEKLFEVDVSKERICGIKPRTIAELSPQHLKKLINKSTKISPETYIKSRKKWSELTKSKNNLRVYECGDIQNVRESFFDDTIMQQCTTEFNSFFKIVGAVLGESKYQIGDTFISSRILYLIQTKKIKYRGSLKNLREVWIKI